MKTPRELLFHEHREVNDRLDAVRSEVVRSLSGPTRAEGAGCEPSTEFLATCWQELFVGCRRWWAGLGVAWCVVLMFLALDSAGPLRQSMLAAATSAPTIEALQERRQLQDELLGIASNHEPHESHPALGPRSDIRIDQRYT